MNSRRCSDVRTHLACVSVVCAMLVVAFAGVRYRAIGRIQAGLRFHDKEQMRSRSSPSVQEAGPLRKDSNPETTVPEKGRFESSTAVTHRQDTVTLSSKKTVPEKGGFESSTALPQLQDTISQKGQPLQDIDKREENSGLQLIPSRLCRKNKLLPNFYLLGSPKCGTSTLARELADAGAASVATLVVGAQSWKEWHFFDEYWIQHKTWDIEAVASKWYDALPKCEQVPKKLKVVADMTPAYLRSVPLGAGLRPNPKFHRGFSEINLPKTLKYAYGELSGDVLFVAMLREPVSQMQSMWYFMRKLAKEKGRKSSIWNINPTFTEDLRLSLSELTRGRVTQLMWPALYSRHLKGYLSEFHASQLVPIPY
eukprot:5319728-Amphidinium_carterae.1